MAKGKSGTISPTSDPKQCVTAGGARSGATVSLAPCTTRAAESAAQSFLFGGSGRLCIGGLCLHARCWVTATKRLQNSLGRLLECDIYPEVPSSLRLETRVRHHAGWQVKREQRSINASRVQVDRLKERLASFRLSFIS